MRVSWALKQVVDDHFAWGTTAGALGSHDLFYAVQIAAQWNMSRLQLEYQAGLSPGDLQLS